MTVHPSSTGAPRSNPRSPRSPHRRRRGGHRLLGAALAVALLPVAAAALSVPADAAGAPATARVSATATARVSATASDTGQLRYRKAMLKPMARERVVRGDVDRDAYAIEHVYEVQLRLRRLGLLDATPNGVFGPLTEQGVKTFQRRQHLRVTGAVNAKTWVRLIRESVRGRKAVPQACLRKGWHACYDRSRHQVNLYHGGFLHQEWLVRGGDYDKQTRVGDYTVYYRDVDHTSGLYDDAPMPYSQFFSGGQALHGSRFMVNPYEGHSHGCINLYVEDARQLWKLTHDKRLRVHVYGAWD